MLVSYLRSLLGRYSVKSETNFLGPHFYTGDNIKFMSNLFLLRYMDNIRVSISYFHYTRCPRKNVEFTIFVLIMLSSNDLNIAEERMLQNFSNYRYVKQYSDEYYPASDKNPSGNENFIYVTYPPEIKRKLLDRYGQKIYTFSVS